FLTRFIAMPNRIALTPGMTQRAFLDNGASLDRMISMTKDVKVLYRAALIKAVYEACASPSRSVDPLMFPKPVVNLSNHAGER
ncbi:MAG: hypothetical protein JXA18_09540, partial [Chitinispirillaceae bacterium]|nr:hypothetical protein [Chitinispirillaceae bacterium]